MIGGAAFSPQGLFPHIISNRDSGIEPHHPALYYGRHLHAEGEVLNSQESEFEVRFKIMFVWCRQDATLKRVGLSSKIKSRVNVGSSLLICQI